MTSFTNSPPSSRTRCPRWTMMRRVRRHGEAGGSGAPGRLLTALPAPSPVPASAVRSRQAGQLPARAPGARAGAGAAAARVTPPLCGRRPAHAGRLRTAAQAAHRERERRAGGARRGGADPRGDPDRAPRPQTVCAHFRQAPIPSELRSVRRYPDNALQEKEFNYTCPHSAEILAAYRPAVRPR